MIGLKGFCNEIPIVPIDIINKMVLFIFYKGFKDLMFSNNKGVNVRFLAIV
jgi:hypothetical protein